MVAYTLSAAPAAVIGAIYAHAILFVVTPDAVFGVLVIVQTLVVCLVGGVGSKWGPLIGSANMVPMSERSEEHTSELPSQSNLVCRRLLGNKNYDHDRAL